jgi:signal transduction histidine kinase
VSGRVNWSDEMYSIYGVHPGEFRPSFESYLERIHPEDRARAAATVALALMDNRAFSMDERIVHPDGRVRQLRSHGEVVRDEDGPAAQDGRRLHRRHRAEGRRGGPTGAHAALVEAEETERRRIARELHDRVGQNLSALNINIDILLGQLRDEPARRRLEDSLKLVDATLQSIENVMADLRPRCSTSTASRRRSRGTARSTRSAPGSGSGSRRARRARACARRPRWRCSG